MNYFYFVSVSQKISRDLRHVHSEGRKDLLGRRDGPVDVLLGVRQGGEARLVLARVPSRCPDRAGNPGFPGGRYG